MMIENQEKRPHIRRWQGEGLPEEAMLRQYMREEGLAPYAWSNGPHDQYAIHQHSYHKILYCVRGSIRFTLPDVRDEQGRATNLDLEPGDRMFLPAGTRHSALVGSRGVTCLEAPREVRES